MNIRTPQPTQAARLLQQFFATQGITVSYSQALEAIARLHGYQNWQAMRADVRFADAPALKPVSSNEYELNEKQHNAWVGVGNISVCITNNDEGVSVDLYAKGYENESLTSTYLHFDEAASAADDAEEANQRDDEKAREFIGSDSHGVSDVLRSIVENHKTSPFVLDGPNFHGVEGNPDSHPCGEIVLSQAQPCVLSVPAFEPAPVNWQSVVDTDTLTHIRINQGPLQTLDYIDYGGLHRLAYLTDLSVHARLAQSWAIEYHLPGSPAEHIMLGALQKAFEHEMGVIDLIDGRRIELFVQDTQGQLLRFSPQQQTLTKV